MIMALNLCLKLFPENVSRPLLCVICTSVLCHLLVLHPYAVFLFFITLVSIFNNTLNVWLWAPTKPWISWVAWSFCVTTVTQAPWKFLSYSRTPINIYEINKQAKEHLKLQMLEPQGPRFRWLTVLSARVCSACGGSLVSEFTVSPKGNLKEEGDFSQEV